MYLYPRRYRRECHLGAKGVAQSQAGLWLQTNGSGRVDHGVPDKAGARSDYYHGQPTPRHNTGKTRAEVDKCHRCGPAPGDSDGDHQTGHHPGGSDSAQTIARARANRFPGNPAQASRSPRAGGHGNGRATKARDHDSAPAFAGTRADGVFQHPPRACRHPSRRAARGHGTGHHANNHAASAFAGTGPDGLQRPRGDHAKARSPAHGGSGGRWWL